MYMVSHSRVHKPKYSALNESEDCSEAELKEQVHQHVKNSHCAWFILVLLIFALLASVTMNMAQYYRSGSRAPGQTAFGKSWLYATLYLSAAMQLIYCSPSGQLN